MSLAPEERNVSFAHKWADKIKKGLGTINIPCLRHSRQMLACLDFFQGFNTTFAHSRIARRFTHARRIVPAALAFLTVGALDRDGGGYLFVTFVANSELHLGNNEYIPK